MLPLLAVLSLALAGCGAAHERAQQVPTGGAPDPVKQVRADPPVRRLVPVAAGRLAAPVQDAAAAPYTGGVVLVGGLTPADVSSDAIVTATRAGSTRIGRIPTALHDSAAVHIGRAVYVFGGGTATTQLDTILMIDPRTGAAESVGHLPTGSSDQAAAAIGRTAYVVGDTPVGAGWTRSSRGGRAALRASSDACRTRCATQRSRRSATGSSSPAGRSSPAPPATPSTSTSPRRGASSASAASRRRPHMPRRPRSARSPS
jgi:Kelch motif protein